MSNIVPLSDKISMLKIRQVLNLRGEIIGMVFASRSQRGRYGHDFSNGDIAIFVKNVGTTNYSSNTVTAKIKTRGGVTLHSSTTTLNAGEAKRILLRSNMSSNTYLIELSETTGTTRSDETSVYVPLSPHQGLTGQEALRIKYNFPTTNIRIGGGVNDNYDLGSTGKYNMNQLPPTVDNADLSDWRGTQSFLGIAVTGSAGTGRYGQLLNNGAIYVTLQPEGFSGGPVSVSVVGYNTQVKNVGSTNNKGYEFHNLPAGTKYIKIEDKQTGNSIVLKTRIHRHGYRRGQIYRFYAFSGNDILTSPRTRSENFSLNFFGDSPV